MAAYAYAIDGSAEREGQGSGGSRGVTLTHLAAFAADGGPAHIDTGAAFSP